MDSLVDGIKSVRRLRIGTEAVSGISSEMAKGLRERLREAEDVLSTDDELAFAEADVYLSIRSFVREIREILVQTLIGNSEVTGKGARADADIALRLLNIHVNLAQEYHASSSERKQRGLRASMEDLSVLTQSADTSLDATKKFLQSCISVVAR